MAAPSSDAYQQVPTSSEPTAPQTIPLDESLPSKQPTQLRQAADSRPGQSARLTRRAAIRAKRQAERRAEQQASAHQPSVHRSGAHKLGTHKSGAKSPTPAEKATEVESPVVHAFRPKRSLWLMLLSWLQHGSTITTLVLVIGVLITYGWTVYVQEQWGKSFARLESLKKQERQLVSANEVLKNQMAEQAEKPTAGLLLPDPSNAIFLTPAPQRPPVKPKPIAPAESEPVRPLGY